MLTLASAPLLTRHLGVERFGQYVTVTSLITIVALVADAGLTAVGVRDYAVRDTEGRRRLMRNLVALRTIIALIGVAGAVGFAVLAGYPGVLVTGTALAGIGLLLMLAQHTYTIPLMAELRLGLTTALDVLRQALTVVGIVVLVIAGGGLLAFLAIPIPVGVVVVALAMLTVRGAVGLRPQLERDELRYLLLEIVPAAVASTLASIFYRVAIVVMSVAATERETGYFSVSFRVVEAVIVIPHLLIGAAYPVLARAAETDETRLAAALQRMFDVSLILGVWIGMAVVLGAEPAIAVLGGPSFEPAVPVLRIQGVALAATFLVTLWGGALWTIRAKRQLVTADSAGLALAIGLTWALAPVHGAQGAAIAMTAAELLLAAFLGIALLASRPALRHSLRLLPRLAVALGAAVATLALGLPDAVTVVAASAVYLAVLWALGGIPPEVIDSLTRLRRAGRGHVREAGDGR